jgi:hypothetical protein
MPPKGDREKAMILTVQVARVLPLDKFAKGKTSANYPFRNRLPCLLRGFQQWIGLIFLSRSRESVENREDSAGMSCWCLFPSITFYRLGDPVKWLESKVLGCSQVLSILISSDLLLPAVRVLRATRRQAGPPVYNGGLGKF